MADTKISQLAAAAHLDKANELAINQALVSKRVLYQTHNAAYLGTTQADFTLADATGVQSLFQAANNLLTVEASTSYLMKALYILNTGSVEHTKALAWALAGGASVTSFEYIAMIGDTLTANTITTSQSTTHISGVASKVINSASLDIWTFIHLVGLVRFNAGGTVEPQINFSVAPGGTNLVKVGTYVKFTPVGSNTMVAVGPWA